MGLLNIKQLTAKDLKGYIDRLGKVSGAKDSILGKCICIESYKGTLFVSKLNSILCIDTGIKMDEDFSYWVDTSKTKKLLTALKNRPIKLNPVEHGLQIIDGNTELLLGKEADDGGVRATQVKDYLELDIRASYTVEALKATKEACKDSLSNDQSRESLMGYFFSNEYAIATDGHIATKLKIPTIVAPEEQFNLSAEMLDDIILQGQDVEIRVEVHDVYVTGKDFAMHDYREQTGPTKIEQFLDGQMDYPRGIEFILDKQKLIDKLNLAKTVIAPKLNGVLHIVLEPTEQVINLRDNPSIEHAEPSCFSSSLGYVQAPKGIDGGETLPTKDGQREIGFNLKLLETAIKDLGEGFKITLPFNSHSQYEQRAIFHSGATTRLLMALRLANLN